MKFRADGPDVPANLIASQERGEVLFICGAGVSMHIGLPGFKGLVQKIYDELGEDWAPYGAEREVMADDGSLKGQYDRVVRALERRLAASNVGRTQGMRDRMRAAVRAALATPPESDLTNHAALLALSRGADGQIRLATTNFDTLFEQAWPSGRAPSHASASMPQPLTASCTGVLHLHGRLQDDILQLADTDIVLTSAEFGDAYLRSGWASRYVYDLVRAYTVVLVGYQADDPPMRYLLEVLEADRERFPDLQPVYAFAHASPDDEALQIALWESKGVQPIIHRSVEGRYSPLYDSIKEWKAYADDPTAWRRRELTPLLAQAPSALSEPDLSRAMELLSHGDAGGILEDRNPEASWLEMLQSRRRLSMGGRTQLPSNPPPIKPGAWIGKRVNDPAMITACAGLPVFDDDAVWFIRRSLDQAEPPLSDVRRQAWDLLLASRTAGGETPEFGMDWYRTAPRIAKGYTGHASRHLISAMTRPRLTLARPFRFQEVEDEGGPETLGKLLWVDFKAALEFPVDDVLAVWPDTAEQSRALLVGLGRTLFDALEEAEDVDFLSGWDGADRDVPSVARHAQNEYRDGFYPIIRLMADLWDRLAERNLQDAAALAETWAASPWSLVQRLALFAGKHAAVPAETVTGWIEQVDDNAFWIGNTRVELTKLLIARWADLPRDRRDTIEARIRQGIPRNLFRAEVVWEDDEWTSTLRNSVYRRLTRLRDQGCELQPESETLLAEIQVAYPEWRPGLGDRDDFGSWSESRTGPDGHPELLDTVEDDKLVDEALRIQQENAFEENDLWRVFVSSDPNRALRGLNARAANKEWEPEAWRPLLWDASENDDGGLQAGLVEALLRMPVEHLSVIVDSVASWMRRQRAALAEQHLWNLWDRLAGIAYAPGPVPEPGHDLETRSLNDAGGVLAWTLIDQIAEAKPEGASEFAGVPDGIEVRLNRVVAAEGYGGLLARVRLSRSLAYLGWVAPIWTANRLVPLLDWELPEAATLWKAQASDQIPRAAIYNALRPHLLQALFSEAIPDRDAEALVNRLLQIVVSHQGGHNPEYDGTAAELRGILARGRPALRRSVALALWRMMGSKENEGENGAERWRTLVGPVFQSIWPLDAALRSAETSKHLVNIALNAGEAFPEAVAAVADLIVPYQLYRIAHSLLLREERGTLHREYPVAFVRLLNALIDPQVAPVPDDLGTVLDDCGQASPEIVNDPGFRRLRGLQRLGRA